MRFGNALTGTMTRGSTSVTMTTARPRVEMIEMKTLPSKWMIVLLAAAVLTPVSVTQASTVGDIITVLEYIGFRFSGTQNILRDNIAIHMDATCRKYPRKSK